MGPVLEELSPLAERRQPGELGLFLSGTEFLGYNASARTSIEEFCLYPLYLRVFRCPGKYSAEVL